MEEVKIRAVLVLGALCLAAFVELMAWEGRRSGLPEAEPDGTLRFGCGLSAESCETRWP